MTQQTRLGLDLETLPAVQTQAEGVLYLALLDLSNAVRAYAAYYAKVRGKGAPPIDPLIKAHRVARNAMTWCHEPSIVLHLEKAQEHRE